MKFENFNVDDYLDAINNKGHIYWDEKEKVFIGKNLGLKRVRNLDKFQENLINDLPDILFFKDNDYILIPYYVDENNIEGGAYKRVGNDFIYKLWNNRDGYIKYGPKMVDNFNGVKMELINQLDDTGRPYVEDNYENDDIDKWRINKISSYLVSKPNKEITNIIRRWISDNRYWDFKKSISDVASYIVNNGLWDKIKDELK
jgi:hypothetical protein